MGKYILSIDQSTQGTKALLLDEMGNLVKRKDKSHEQIINPMGWVSHNQMEIYENTIEVVRELIEEADIPREALKGIGISNQRETSMAWDKKSGLPLGEAIVWQCARAVSICEDLNIDTEYIRKRTGIPLSPYFPAAKIAWILKHVEEAKERAEELQICHGTMDTWLVYRLTKGRSYKTDYSNASRTQLFNIFKLEWDQEICDLFGIDVRNMAEVCDSDAIFGETDFEGFLPHKIPIHAVLGDSHAALFGQGCLKDGMMKATYGTGSSIMMNTGESSILSKCGVVTSLAWSLNGKVNYVLEGNLNYTGAVITWLKNDMKLIESPKDTQEIAKAASQDDELYLVPAFSGLGAPYWDSNAKAAITGMTRTTRRAEIIRAGLDSIAYQIADIVKAVGEDAKMEIVELRVDGGPTKNTYLMQFQSDILGVKIQVPDAEELSGIGVAYVAGISLGIWDESIFASMKHREYAPKMTAAKRNSKYDGWRKAVDTVISK